MTRHQDTSLLAAALVGYQAELDRVNAAIADLKKRLGNGGVGRSAGPFSNPPARKKNRISPEGRARIAAAQRRRWAAAKKAV